MLNGHDDQGEAHRHKEHVPAVEATVLEQDSFAQGTSHISLLSCPLTCSGSQLPKPSLRLSARLPNSQRKAPL